MTMFLEVIYTFTVPCGNDVNFLIRGCMKTHLLLCVLNVQSDHLCGDSSLLYKKKKKEGCSVSPSHLWVCKLLLCLKPHWLFSGLNCSSTFTLHVQIPLHYLCYHSLLIFSSIVASLCKLRTVLSRLTADGSQQHCKGDTIFNK